MVLILLSWIYIFITITNFGILFTEIFKIKNCNIAIYQVLGLFLYATVTCIFAFFIRISVEYFLAILFINLMVFLKFKKTFKSYLFSIRNRFNSFKLSLKLLYSLLFFIVLAKSSTEPYLLDNESYYIQTIKWINEYGYVKGLANVHMFLGQNSIWHTLQAGLNFSFVTNIFNDVNGYLFAIFGFLAVDKLRAYGTDKSNRDLSLGLVLIFSLFLMQFVNAPSPDLIAFLIGPYIFYLFIINYENPTQDDFKVIFSLALFLCFVKVVNVLLVILPLILYFKNFKILKKETFKFVFLGILILILFVSKNAIITGYLFYPKSVFDILGVDWKLPKKLLELSPDAVSMSFTEKVRFWLTAPKLDGLFNKLYVLLIFIFPFVLFKRKERVSLGIIYVLSILQIVLLWNNSPQYRFFFVFVIFLSIEILTTFFKHKRLLITLTYLSVILCTIPLFLNIRLSALTNNKFAMDLSKFELKNVIVPEGITRTKTEFSSVTIHGFEFNTPGDEVFFWSTGNGELPCVNKKQIEFLSDFYNYIPQKRTEDLKDGFHSLLLKSENQIE